MPTAISYMAFVRLFCPSHQSFHQLHGSYRILGIAVRANLCGVILRDRRAAHNDLHIQSLTVHFLYDLLHIRHGGSHQCRQTDNIRMVLPGGSNYGLLVHILSQVEDSKSVVLHHHSHQVLADIMDISLDRGNNHCWSLAVSLCFHEHRF